MLLRFCGQENQGKTFLILSRNNNCLGTDIGTIQQKIRWFLKSEFKYSDDDAKKIKVKTIHSSKGDEADNVIILEANADKLPLIHPDTVLYSIFGENEITVMQDEIRLFYVAITRAKEHLTILYDYIDDQGKPKPSPFIYDMDTSRLTDYLNIIRTIEPNISQSILQEKHGDIFEYEDDYELPF